MKLDKNKTYIALFTRGRINKQKSLRYFTPEMVKSTIVVTADSEKEELKAALKTEGFDVLKVISFPDDHRLITKRYKTAKYLQKHGCKHFFMCDDDAALSVLIGDRYRSTRSEEGQAALSKLWATIPKLWSDYTTLGISANSRNNRNFFIDRHTHKPTGLFVQDSTKNGLFFGANVKWFVEQFKWLESNKLLQDVAYMDIMTSLLGVMTGRTGRIYNLAWATTFDDKKSSGGMNLYRTHKTNKVSVLLLMLMFPGIVSMREQERIVFETFKLERHAWRPVEDWNSAKVDWAKWFKAAEAQLREVMKDNPKFKRHAVYPYVQRKLEQMGTLARKLGPTLVLHDSISDAEFGRTRGERAVKMALKASSRGDLVSVIRTGRGSELKSIEHQINVNIVRNWRTS